jgi:hypothetical protein
MIKKVLKKLQAARIKEQTTLETEVTAGVRDASMKLAHLESEIEKAEYEMTLDIPIEMSDEEKTAHSNAWQSYRERNEKLITHQGKAFSLIIGQCTQLLQDKMKQDSDWITVNTSYDPLSLYRLIEKHILSQTENQYPFHTVYTQEQAFYSFKQESLSNPQWYERFNTKVDVGTAVGVSRQHKGLLEYVAMELYNQSFETLGDAEQQAVREDTEERYTSLAFLLQSGSQHSKLKESSRDSFTMGNNNYPKTHQQTLHLLDNHSKLATQKATPSEGSSFTQHGGRGRGGRGRGKGKGGQSTSFDKEKFKNHKCKKCGETGHPNWSCPKDNDDGDSKSQASFCGVELVKRASPLSEEIGESKSLKKASGDRVGIEVGELVDAEVGELVGAEVGSLRSMMANTTPTTIEIMTMTAPVSFHHMPLLSGLMSGTTSATAAFWRKFCRTRFSSSLVLTS